MKTSLCITILNEENSVIRLLDSIYSGSKRPDEIIIVDGGSTDKTVSTISKYNKLKSNRKIRTRLIKGNKIGIAEGRNISIKNASGEIIVMTDAGCIVKKDWLEKITQPFELGNIKISRSVNRNTLPKWTVDIVAGFYEMPAKKPIQSVFGVYLGVPPERYNPETFIPSARSVAFRKEIWKKIGGFNQKLDQGGEDTVFFYEAVKNKFKIKRVGEAQVVWEEIANLNLRKVLTKIYNYAKGDSRAGIWWDPIKKFESHNIKILFIFMRYFIAFILFIIGFYITSGHLLLLILSILYFFYPIVKWSDVIRSWKARLWLPVIQVTSDLAVMSGFVCGIL